MLKCKTLSLVIFCLTMIGCHAPYVDVGAGYVRFETDDIVFQEVTEGGNVIRTEITHVDALSVKAKFGGSPIEALSQLKVGMEVRGGIGAGYDDDEVDGEELYSDLILLMIGGGPYVSWKQPLGDYFFIEAGVFGNAYTVGLHQSEQEDADGNDIDFDEEGAVGWSGGAFAKMGLLPNHDNPYNFALEVSYEVGEWEFGGDIDDVDVQGFSFLISSEIKF